MNSGDLGIARLAVAERRSGRLHMAALHAASLCAAFLLGTLSGGNPARAAEELGPQNELVRINRELAELSSAARSQAGRTLYQSACEACHGRHGDGRGPKWKALPVAPRDFRQGLFKLRSTPFGALPTDEDLDRVIRQGVSGTDMVPFGKVMSRENRAAVIEYIKSFSPRFRDAEGKEPRKPVSLPAQRPFPASEASIAAGKALFAEKGCFACHGQQGDGKGPAAGALVDGWGSPIRPWDFTLGYYKSGATDLDLFRTITTGMNGTPMPSFDGATSEEERWKLVDYVRSLGRKRSSWATVLFVSEPTGVVYDGN